MLHVSGANQFIKQTLIEEVIKLKANEMHAKKLFRISQSVNLGYDTYDSAVVVARTVDEARNTHPGEYEEWDEYSWCKPAQVEVEYVGQPRRGMKLGVVVASFRAG